MMTTNSPEQAIRPLGISHLLILTATIAMMSAWQEWSHRLFDTAANMPALPYAKMFRFASAISTGGLIAALIWLVLEYRRTGKLLRHPGHWMLFLKSCSALAHLVRNSLLFFFFQIDEMASSDRSYVIYLGLGFIQVAGLIIGWICSIIAARKEYTATWVWVFGLMLFVTILELLTPFAVFAFRWQVVYWSTSLIQVMILLAIAFAAIRDVRLGVKRDWMHWYAIGMAVLAFVISPLLQLLVVFALR